MFNFYKFLIALILICIFKVNSLANPCEPYYDCEQWASGTYGCKIGSYRGVDAKSNDGGWNNIGCGRYQCVEYVNRFYLEAMHFNVGSWHGSGNEYYGSAEEKGLRVFDQNGTFEPIEGDILCFEGGSGGYGHVAIVEHVDAPEVAPRKIRIMDQNRDNDDPEEDLDLTETNGHYTVSSFSQAYLVQGWLRGYTCAYSSQDPNVVVTMIPGETRKFTVQFENTSRPAAPKWTNDGGDHSIELHSCNSAGDEVPCFMYPVEGKPAWLDPANRIGIVRMSNTDVGTNDMAVFEFWAKVPETATPGRYDIYFRPYHNSGKLIEDWGKMHFVIWVVQSQRYTAFFDDFEDGDDVGWVQVKDGSWSIESGKYVFQCNGDCWGSSLTGSPGWTDYTLEADVNFVYGYRPTFWIRVQDVGSHYSGYLYSVALGAAPTNDIVLLKYEQHVEQWRQSFPYHFENGVLYHVSISVAREEILVEIDDNLVIDFTDPGTVVLQGGIALGGSGTMKAEFDNVKVTYGTEVLANDALSNLPPEYTPQLAEVCSINPGEKKILQLVTNKVAQFFRFLLNWPGSELNLKVYKPNGALYGEWQDTIPPIMMEVAGPDTGLWNFEVTAVNVPDSNYPFAAVVGSKPVTWIAGDVNEDGLVRVSDVVYLINYLFRNGPSPIPIYYAGDVNCSYSVSVSDAVYLVNYLFKGGPLPCEPQ
jgi:surface antigen